MRDIALTVFFVIALYFAMRRPHYGIYLWSWLSYMNPHKQAWGFAQSMPFAMVTALVTLTSYLFSKEPKRIPWAPELILMFLFLVWVTITTFFAFYPQLAWEQWGKVWKILLMTLVTAMLISSRERLIGLIWVIALSLGYYGIKGGLFTIAHGGVYRVQGPYGTFIGGNNEIALALIMTVPLMRFLHLQEKRLWLKWGLAGAMILTALAAIGSQSRGALLAIGAMSVFLWLKSRQKFILAFYIVLAVGLVAAIMPQEWYERMTTIKTYEQDASAQGRINAWHTAVNVAKAHITGGGFEMFQYPTFKAYAPDPANVHDVHSIYFEIIGEHGFVGFLIWLLLGLTAWRTGNKTIKACKKVPERKWAVDLAAMTQVSLIGYAAGGAFLGLAYFDYYYHLVIVMMLTYYIAVKNFWDTEPALESRKQNPSSSRKRRLQMRR